MASLWISTILIFLIQKAASEYDPSVCLIQTNSYGLIPPPLPRNFEMKAEMVDHVQNTVSYEEVYFDYTNSRAKYTILINTTERHHLLDYDTQQVVEWIKLHPGVSMTQDPLSLVCTATDMDDSSVVKIFGYQDYLTQKPKMFNSYEMLRYGGKYLYAADGSLKLKDRNMGVNKFVGCIYDESINATMKSEFFFSDNYTQPSGGTPSSLLTASSELMPLSVPVKIRMTGKKNVGNKQLPINVTTSISWFRGKPDFHFNTFTIPPWVNCKDFEGRKDIPKLPNAFSTRVDVMTYSVDTFGQLVEKKAEMDFERIYYDADKLLARRDYTPKRGIDSEIYSKFGSLSPVSTIYDFTEGLMYAINKHSGRCFIRPILENEYFDTEKQLLYRKLASPGELFRMQMDDIEYKGKNVARDVMCDVWNGKHFHELYNTTFIKETYFSTDGWHELADGFEEYSVPIKHLVINEELDENLTQTVTAYNFLKFKAKPPLYAVFNIKNCVEQIQHRRFAIPLLEADDLLKLVFQYKFLFLDSAQQYIANKTGVHSPLRVQRLHLRHLSPGNPKPFLVFSLLEKVNFKDLPIVVSQKGTKLQDAVILLQKLMESGKFAVKFTDPQTKQVVEMLAGQPLLYELTADGEFTPAPILAEADEDESYEMVNLFAEDENSEVEERSGMTGGHLALLAFAMLFIGVGIGICIMYLYLRLNGERTEESSISMRTTAAKVAASEP